MRMVLIRWLLNCPQDHYEKHLRGLEEGFIFQTFQPPPDESSYNVSNATFRSPSMEKGSRDRGVATGCSFSGSLKE